MHQLITAGDLEIAYEAFGNPQGRAAVLLHGFPYDVSGVREAAQLLAADGYRVVAPYLRGFGPTRFLSAQTMRSGQQTALAHDLIALIDALELDCPVVAGYDWGGRAACIVAALWPERVAGLVSCDGYNIQDIAKASTPLPPEQEAPLWYQYYFHSARGLAGLSANRNALCRLLWQQWSPTWPFEPSVFDAAASSLANPDFVDVVIHSYRHRFGLVEGDTQFEESERQLADQPSITVPSIVISGADNGLRPVMADIDLAPHFTGPMTHHVLPGVGHNLPQEAPSFFADAVARLLAR